ncbi:hypothetical protein HanXRQr2_Chr15g0699521 [Helianthus annuus]|uniref:Uncharacterized protein n=1 Tax=Helianthus annuus TaxID=4232 RepID=A0A251S953_HELAN|nr:hypothetical protein HanXRQr2_Chr15g0699521 [Helianthus annuus]KAJ0831792.1 hypothetical protein HanPSC8_Chr15g0671221 [Helianthus annuus]
MPKKQPVAPRRSKLKLPAAAIKAKSVKEKKDMDLMRLGVKMCAMRMMTMERRK